MAKTGFCYFVLPTKRWDSTGFMKKKSWIDVFLGDFFKEKLRIVLNETQTCLIEMEKESDLDKENQKLLSQIDQCKEIN